MDRGRGRGHNRHAAVSIVLVAMAVMLELCGGALSSGLAATPAAPWPARTAVASSVHVAPATRSVDPGSDSRGDGSAAKPFATLARAQLAVRGVLARGGTGITVRIAGGEYFENNITLTEKDSGHGRVVWQGEPGATLYGGALIRGWTQYRGGIWQAPLPKALVDSEGRALFRTLVQGAHSAWLARTPNFGSGFLPCAGSGSSFHCAAGVLPAGFDCQVSGTPGDNNASSACSVFMRAGYSSDIRAVTGVFTQRRTLHTPAPHTLSCICDINICRCRPKLSSKRERCRSMHTWRRDRGCVSLFQTRLASACRWIRGSDAVAPVVLGYDTPVLEISRRLFGRHWHTPSRCAV